MCSAAVLGQHLHVSTPINTYEFCSELQDNLHIWVAASTLTWNTQAYQYIYLKAAKRLKVEQKQESSASMLNLNTLYYFPRIQRRWCHPPCTHQESCEDNEGICFHVKEKSSPSSASPHTWAFCSCTARRGEESQHRPDQPQAGRQGAASSGGCWLMSTPPVKHRQTKMMIWGEICINIIGCLSSAESNPLHLLNTALNLSA